jgi:hypothetical protein
VSSKLKILNEIMNSLKDDSINTRTIENVLAGKKAGIQRSRRHNLSHKYLIYKKRIWVY